MVSGQNLGIEKCNLLYSNIVQKEDYTTRSTMPSVGEIIFLNLHVDHKPACMRSTWVWPTLGVASGAAPPPESAPGLIPQQGNILLQYNLNNKTIYLH